MVWNAYRANSTITEFETIINETFGNTIITLGQISTSFSVSSIRKDATDLRKKILSLKEVFDNAFAVARSEGKTMLTEMASDDLKNDYVTVFVEIQKFYHGVQDALFNR